MTGTHLAELVPISFGYPVSVGPKPSRWAFHERTTTVRLPLMAKRKISNGFVNNLLLGVALLVLAVVGWNSRALYSMNGVVLVTADRVDRIANVLPEMGRYVAYEEINKPVSGALVVYSPHLENSGWVVRVDLLDTANGKHYTYVLPALSGQDSTHAMLIAGNVRSLDRTLPSFGDMQGWHIELGQAWEVPATINYHGSFVLRGTHNSDYVSFLNEYAGAPLTLTFDASVDSWGELVQSLENRATDTFEDGEDGDI